MSQQPVKRDKALVNRPGGGPIIRVNNYTLDTEIGKGSFAKVYRAVLKQTNANTPPTIFAVKVINKRSLQKKLQWKKKSEERTPQLVSLYEKVLNEIEIWSRLCCTNIIALKEILDGGPNGNLYIIMENARFGQIMNWHSSTLTYRCPRLEEGVNALPHELARHYFRDVLVCTRMQIKKPFRMLVFLF